MISDLLNKIIKYGFGYINSLCSRVNKFRKFSAFVVVLGEVSVLKCANKERYLYRN